MQTNINKGHEVMLYIMLQVTPVMLQQHLFKKQEYIVTLFLSNCDKNKEACDNILEELEKVRNIIATILKFS